MFGAGIPVLAVSFPALPELVKNGKNGFVFESKDELSEELIKLSKDEKLLKGLKEEAKKEGKHTWAAEWSKKFPKGIWS